jgi:hypothetical protein
MKGRLREERRTGWGKRETKRRFSPRIDRG